MSHLQYPTPGAIVPPRMNGAPGLWLNQGLLSPTAPSLSADFAHITPNANGAMQPKTPKTPKGVSVPSRESNLSEVGFPSFLGIWESLLRKCVDEAHYGNCFGIDSSVDGSGASTAAAVAEVLQGVVAGHLPALKHFLNSHLRATVLQLPTSPNPATVAAPIPPLATPVLLHALGSFLSQSLLGQQLSSIGAHMLGQVHFVLGQVLRGAGWPVETGVMGREASGTGCGLRLLDSLPAARLFVFRAAMAALASRARAAGATAPPSPIFYLSPSFAHAIGLPESLPRLCWELGVSASAFKILPLAPSMDERVLNAIGAPAPRLVDPFSDAAAHSGSVPEGEPNPFLSYQMDAASVEAELAADAAAAASTGATPCALFLTLGNAAGLDLPYEHDHVAELAAVCARHAVSMHAEGERLWAESEVGGGHPVSALFEAVDSVTLSPGSWLGLTSAPTLVAVRDPRLLPEESSPPAPGAPALPSVSARAASGFAASLESFSASPSMLALCGVGPDGAGFAPLFSLWSTLLQLSPQAFPSLLARLSARQSEKVRGVRELLRHASIFSAPVAPAGEESETRAAYLSHLAGQGLVQWLPPAPSHSHLFFHVSLRAPLSPRQFHLTEDGLNAHLARRLQLRLASRQGDQHAAWSRVLGLHLLPAQHFERIGFMYVPAPVTVWNEGASDELPAVASVIAGLSEEVSLLESTARLRLEFEQLLEGEDEWAFVPWEHVAHTPGVGVGAVVYRPAQLPDQHADEIGALLCESLERLPSAMQLAMAQPSNAPPSDPSASPTSSTQLASMYRSGRVGGGPHAGAVCTVLGLSELAVRKGARELLAELKGAAARLQYPAHIVESMGESLREGIRAAEEKISLKSAEAFRPTNVLRWIPVVGSVISWVAPAAPEDGPLAYDMKRRELSTRYSYAERASSAAGASNQSRKTSLSLNTAPGATPSSLTPTPFPSTSSVSPLVTPSPLSINHSAAAQAQIQAQAQAAAAQGQTGSLSTAATPTSVTSSPRSSARVAAAPPSMHTPPHGAFSPPQQQQTHGAGVAAQPNGHMTGPAALPHAATTQLNASSPPHAQAQTHAASTRAPPVRVTLDQADQEFVPLLNSAPRMLSATQAALLSRGETFLAYFPSADEDEAAQQAASAAGGQPSSPATSVTKLYLFLEAGHVPGPEEAAELGVLPNEPVDLLVWCEPGQRYLRADQAVAVQQLTQMHAGVASGREFPRQVRRDACFSLITQHVALHLEAESAEKRREWFLALYSLVASVADADKAVSMQQQQHLVPAGATQSQALVPSGGIPATPASASDVDDDRLVSAARSLLQAGQPFTVYVLDRHDIDVTTPHSVTLWYRPAQGGQPHALCWCRRGAQLDYSPSRSLPLNQTVQICVGKQTKALKNAAAVNCDPAAAFSVMVQKMILNLEAESPEARARWLSAFHSLMSASGKRRVFDDTTQAAQPDANEQV